MELSRGQVLAYRRRVMALEERLPFSRESLRRAAFAGLQDSMPRAALLSLHARVSGASPETWAEPPLVQVWGLRYSAFVIAEVDLAAFTLGRLPTAPKARARAEDIAHRLEVALEGERMDVRDAATRVGVHPNALRYAAPTGRFLIHWDGARQPLIWGVPAPDVDPIEARMELVRRHLHVLGFGTPETFASWAGVKPREAAEAFAGLEAELVPATTPIGSGWLHASDEAAMRDAPPGGSVATRLLPSGDTYYLLQGEQRELLLPDEAQREQLWTSRVWPGAVLHEGEIVGTWRRSQHRVSVTVWRSLGRADRRAIEHEAATLPIPGATGDITVDWD